MKNTLFDIIIGVEIHAQLNLKKKLFSNVTIHNTSKQNVNCDFIDLGMPGTLPTLNIEAIQSCIFFGKLINGKINKKIKFDRKHYFYPDLTKGYQITQKENPLIKNGYVILEKNNKKINIKQVHIEEDTGKLNHKKNDQYTYINYNRAGIALLEIVSNPELKSKEETIEYVKKIHNILKENNICKGRLDKGEFRCDINISLKKKNQNILNNKVEIKNLNSFKFISDAIDYEINRQTSMYTINKEIKNETRGFNKKKKTTYLLRQKEVVSEYGYCSEPNIPIFYITNEDIENIYKQYKKKTPTKILYFKKKYDLNEKNINLLKKKGLIKIYKNIAAEHKNKKIFQIIFQILTNIDTTLLKKIEKKNTPYNETLCVIKKILNIYIYSTKTNTDYIELKKNIKKTIDATKNIKENGIEEYVIKQIINDVMINNKKKINFLKILNYIIMEYIKKTNNKNNLKNVESYIKNYLLKTYKYNTNELLTSSTSTYSFN